MPSGLLLAEARLKLSLVNSLPIGPTGVRPSPPSPPTITAVARFVSQIKSQVSVPGVVNDRLAIASQSVSITFDVTVTLFRVTRHRKYSVVPEADAGAGSTRLELVAPVMFVNVVPLVLLCH